MHHPGAPRRFTDARFRAIMDMRAAGPRKAIWRMSLGRYQNSAPHAGQAHRGRAAGRAYRPDFAVHAGALAASVPRAGAYRAHLCLCRGGGGPAFLRRAAGRGLRLLRRGAGGAGIYTAGRAAGLHAVDIAPRRAAAVRGPAPHIAGLAAVRGFDGGPGPLSGGHGSGGLPCRSGAPRAGSPAGGHARFLPYAVLRRRRARGAQPAHLFARLP